ncbi:MAG: sigma-70 family RNA polymerase sigma factor [Planctomycetota bacterium]
MRDVEDTELQTASDSDWALARGLIAKRPEAWRLLTQTHGRLIRSRVADAASLYERAHDTAAIDDVTAEVFATLLARDAAALRAFQGRSRLGTYLAVIATRVSMRCFSKWSRSTDRHELAESGSIGDSAAAPLVRMIQSEDQDRLLRLIEQLPDRPRRLIQLHYIQGLTYKQIGQQESIPVGSIGPTLRRAEARLREWIEKGDASKQGESKTP